MFTIDKIIPIYFFVSLFIGFFLVYTYTPPPKVILKYPTPENANILTYKDSGDNCFKYEVKQIECPRDKSKISKIPQQHEIIENN